MSEEMNPLRKNQKKGLGRGLGSLLGEARTHSDPAEFQRVETVAKANVTPATKVASVPPPAAPTLPTSQAVGIRTLSEPATISEPPKNLERPKAIATIISRPTVTPPNTVPVAKPAAPAPAPTNAPAAIAKPVVSPAPATVAVAAPTPPPQVQSSITNSPDRIWRVAIEKVFPNKEQPRKHFEPARLQDLASSLKEKGVLLPIIVRPMGPDSYEIVAGERRWRAAQLAGLQEVPVLIRKSENREALELALIENIQRQDINPLEEAEAYGVLASRYGLTQQQIAEKVSKDRSTVANLMRLIGLASEVKSMVRGGELPMGQAKVLLALADPGQQTILARKIVKLGLSVRATEKLVAKAKESPVDELEIEDEAENRREIQALKSELQKLLGTKVELDLSGQRSKISIQFYSMPELNQFVEKLRKL